MNAIFEGRCPRVLCALAVGAGMLSSAQIVLAQQAADEPVQRVEITGSSIKRIESEGALPVQTFTRADIERSGASSATELIQKLPAMQGFTHTSESVGGGGAGLATASLRSLGDRTLVLLNGRRIASWAGQTLTGYGNGVDLNTIPIAAIDRVEVLTDGASALYGTDAIGGVVNFITRTDYQKLELFAERTSPQHPGGKGSRYSITKGFGDLAKDGSNFLIAYNKDHQDQIKGSDRPFASTGNIYFNEGGQFYNFGNFSTRSIPANVLGLGVPPGDGFLNPYYTANGGSCPSRHLPVATSATTGICLFDYTSTVVVQPEQDRQSLLLSGRMNLGNGITAYGDYVRSKSEVLWKIAPAPVDVPLVDTDPAYLAHLTGLGVTGPVTARWRMMDAGNRTSLDTTVANHLVAGVKGFSFGWDYDASLTVSRNYWTEDLISGWLGGNELVAALGAGTIDPFLLPGQQSAAGMSAIDAAQIRGEFKAGTTKLTVLNAKGSREMFDAGGGKAMLGAGVDVRKEGSVYKPSLIAQGIGNNIAGDSAQDIPFDLSRTAYGMFGELLVPLSKVFEVTGALRYDHYSDFGSTLNGKAALRWQPNKEWLLRTSLGTGFKAPTVPQSADVIQHYGVTGGSYICPLAPGDPLCGGITVPNQWDVWVQGNPNLTPEKSTQFALGTRFEPTASFSLGVDYWSIRLRNRIGALDEAVIFNDPVKYQNLLTSFTDPTSGQTLLAIILKNDNLGEARASGLDIDMVGRVGVPGTLSLTSRLMWTHMLKHELQDEIGGPFHSDLGVFASGLGTQSGVVFKDILRWSNTLDVGKDWTHTLTINYKSGYRDQVYTAADEAVTDAAGTYVDMVRKVKPYMTADWQTNFRWGKQFKLTAGIVNLFDADPPLSIRNVGPHNLGYDARYTDPVGRTYYFNMRYEM